MNNFIMGFKRFITNKNVVTIIGVLVALGILFWGYTSSINSQINPITVPVASRNITQKTQITNQDIIYVEVAGSMVSQDVVRNANQIIGMYTNVNVTVPQGSMFYNDWLVSGNNLPGNWIEQLDYEAGELGYYMSVNIENTLGNNVLPDTYIDIYMKANDENGTTMFGKLLKNVKVLVVHDSSGNDVFQDTTRIGSPSKIGFAVSQDLYIMLKKAQYLNIELIIAPRGSTIPSENYVVVTSATLRDYIDAQTITVEEDVVVDEVTNPNGDIDTESNQPVVE